MLKFTATLVKLLTVSNSVTNVKISNVLLNDTLLFSSRITDDYLKAMERSKRCELTSTVESEPDSGRQTRKPAHYDSSYEMEGGNGNINFA